MKVAMIGQKGIPSRSGGVEIHVEEICSRLTERGYDVVVYCRKNYCNGKAFHRGIHLEYIPSINTKHLDAIVYSLIATIKALICGFDIYHYHALGPSTVAWIPRLFGKKVICTVHGLDWQRDKWGRIARSYLKFGEYSCAKFANKVITVSETLVDYFSTKYNIKAEYIPNGINIPQKRNANIITSKYGLKEGEYILFLARLVPEKGAHFLIQAFNKLNTNKKLVIAGGSSHSDQYVSSLHKIAEGNDNIIFTGFASGDLLKELYSNAFLYVLPSSIEGMPISLLEAMSYNLLCLVSDIKENISVMKNYGYQFVNYDVDDLINKLNIILSENGIKYTNCSQIEYIINNFCWDTITSKLETVYKELTQ